MRDKREIDLRPNNSSQVPTIAEVNNRMRFSVDLYPLEQTGNMFIGERRNILSVKVERIPVSQQKEMLPKIQEALPPELRGVPVAFL